MTTRTHASLDPRSIITPDAFEVAPSLLGTPLARPSRRLVALLIDLAVIGVVTLLTRSFALVLGVVAAAAFLRLSFKRTAVPGSVFGRAMRLSLGCLGLFIGLVTVIVIAAVGFGGGGAPELPEGAVVRVNGGEAVSLEGLGGLRGLLGGLDDARQLATADDSLSARRALEPLAQRMLAGGMTASEAQEVLEELLPAGLADEVDAPALVRDVVMVAEAASTTAPGSAPADDAAATESALAEEVEALTTSAALRRYADLLDEGDEDSPEAAALRPRLLEVFAADTLAALAFTAEELRAVADAREERIRELRDTLAREREGGGIFAWLRDVVDELGFGFGWASLYLTVMLSWWNGQTVGKRLMGVRVVRLDGEPINWWTAFERAGGYAAGFATGLLGFAQVWWDANRQAIHDRIVGTVVVVDGAEPIRTWEQAL